MKLWITAGGTGSAWHICTIAKKYYAQEIELFVSDINESYLVASSTLADHFFKVPPVKEPGYAQYMYHLLKENEIDVIIPLIPWEQKMFSRDNEEFSKLGIRSLSPDQATNDLLNNKVSLYHFCKEHDIPTIEIMFPQETAAEQPETKEKSDAQAIAGEKYTCPQVLPDEYYFVKPLDGFGAMGTRKSLGRELTQEDFAHAVVQEYCGDENGILEITVEAFWKEDKLHTIARRRIEAKSGVCTKAEILNVPEATEAIRKMVSLVPFPEVFNVQFIKKDGTWKVMDVNLRLAAGTGLSNAAGFQLIRALLAGLLGQEIPEEWFRVDTGIKSILRVYEEVVVR